MSVFKRGVRGVYRYDFWYRKTRYQGSTGQTKRSKAVLFESKMRADMAMQRVGLVETKTAPTFRVFMEQQFLEFVRRNGKTRGSIDSHVGRTKSLLTYRPWVDLPLSAIDGALIEQYKAWRIRSVSIVTVNRDLATLRRALRLAVEWKLIRERPAVHQLPGENVRTFTVSVELEREYLAVAEYPIREAAILMLDCGLRPGEAIHMRRDDIADDALVVRCGKTKNARRAIPLTARAKAAIEFVLPYRPESTWLFAGRKDGPLHRATLDKIHVRMRKANDWPAEFVLHSFRHTFGTRLAESGANPFQIRELMGHSHISVSERYVHPRADDLSLTMKRKELLDRILRGEVHAETSAVERKN